jgi:hypothetical protein
LSIYFYSEIRRSPIPTTTARLSVQVETAATTYTTRSLSQKPGGNVNVKIQIASDLHFEFYSREQVIPEDIIVPYSAPILALLGVGSVG